MIHIVLTGVDVKLYNIQFSINNSQFSFNIYAPKQRSFKHEPIDSMRQQIEIQTIETI